MLQLRFLCIAALGVGTLGMAVAWFPQRSSAQPSQDERRVIAIDPGHGGTESGAVYALPGGSVQLAEKDVNLAIALFLAEDLRGNGFDVVLTRSTDSRVNEPPLDRNGDRRIDDDDDLQARVDIANDARASLLLSIHNNGSPSPRTRGTSTWYAAAHPLGTQGRALAEIAQAELLTGLRGAGYEPIDQGANDDPPLQKPYGHLFLVGPGTPRVARPSEMPGIVGESLYVTSDVESQLLGTETIQRAIAGAYARAVERYFVEVP